MYSSVFDFIICVDFNYIIQDEVSILTTICLKDVPRCIFSKLRK